MMSEQAERTRDQALQKVKELEKEREQAIAREDELEALKLSEALAKAQVKLEIEEIRCTKAQETLSRVNADKPKAIKVLNELQDLWSKYRQVVIEVSTFHKKADAKAAEIPSLHSAMISKITEYERLTEEKIPAPPFLSFLPYRGISPSPEDLKWEPETRSQNITKQMKRSAPTGTVT